MTGRSDPLVVQTREVDMRRKRSALRSVRPWLFSVFAVDVFGAIFFLVGLATIAFGDLQSKIVGLLCSAAGVLLTVRSHMCGAFPQSDVVVYRTTSRTRKYRDVVQVDVENGPVSSLGLPGSYPVLVLGDGQRVSLSELGTYSRGDRISEASYRKSWALARALDVEGPTDSIDPTPSR